MTNHLLHQTVFATGNEVNRDSALINLFYLALVSCILAFDYSLTN